MIPRISISGNASARGHQYGESARRQIQLSLDNYRDVFQFYAQWDWETVLNHARSYIDSISKFDPELIYELRGIAEGSNVRFEEILAINTRTEIMFAAKAREVAAKLPSILECTSFVQSRQGDDVLIGQNWDWLASCSETFVLIEADLSNGIKYVTGVEAGLLAKFGMNSQGLGVATNALITLKDQGNPGIPYHIMLRAILGAASPIDAIKLMNAGYRSSSANYLVAHRNGLAINMETTPGGWSDIFYTQPDSNGVIIHTNHFLEPNMRQYDISPGWIPSTLFRLHSAQTNFRAVTEQTGSAIWKNILCSHTGDPFGVCAHRDQSARKEEQFQTITSVIMNLTHQTLEISSGLPCENNYEFIDYSLFLS